MKRSNTGFSLIELLVVVAIAIIVTAISLPAVRRTVSSYQLGASGRNVANMLQATRAAATKNNTPYYAQYNTAAGPLIVNALSAPEIVAGTAPTSADPTTNVAANAVFIDPGGAVALPNHVQLETAMGVAAGTAQIGGVLGFNTRGLPCLPTASPWICNGPVGFEWFMQHEMTKEWEAVTISPAGRIKVWRSSGNGTWE